MVDPMMERSGNGQYAKLANSLSTVMAKEYESKSISAPSVITRQVMKAVRANKPKTRYAAGKYACTLLFSRKWLSDRMFDRMITSML
jgi:hypothetical protein